MKASKSSPVAKPALKESQFTLMVLLFLVTMTLFLMSYSFAEARRTRVEFNRLEQLVEAQRNV